MRWPASTARSPMAEGIERRVVNALLVKVLEAVETAHCAGYACIMSRRSGETEDAIDLAVATNYRLAVALGPPRQIQPTAAHRGRAREFDAALGREGPAHPPRGRGM